MVKEFDCILSKETKSKAMFFVKIYTNLKKTTLKATTKESFISVDRRDVKDADISIFGINRFFQQPCKVD